MEINLHNACKKSVGENGTGNEGVARKNQKDDIALKKTQLENYMG